VRALAIASVTVTVLGLTTAPAHAETWRGQDASGDVKSFQVDLLKPCKPPTDETALPDDRRHDLTTLAVAHGADAVSVQLGLRDVVPHDRGTSYELVVRTPDGMYDVQVTTSSSGRTVSSFATAKVTHDPGCAYLDTHQRRCRGFTAKIDPQQDQVAVTVPRTCLGEPRWVRVGAWVAGFDPDSGSVEDPVVPVTFDAAGSRGGVITVLPPFGPKVH
jgi:hypothetical protein